MTTGCLPNGDGFLRAHLRGAIDTTIDWPNAGTRCQGDERPDHQGVRLSFSREPASAPDLLFVFGISKVQQGRSAHGIGVNLTVIVQGTPRVFGTRGESRCTVDSLMQQPLPTPPVKSAAAQSSHYRLEAHGFCTQPARAVRGEGAILLTSFDFAGIVSFSKQEPSA